MVEAETFWVPLSPWVHPRAHRPYRWGSPGHGKAPLNFPILNSLSPCPLAPECPAHLPWDLGGFWAEILLSEHSALLINPQPAVHPALSSLQKITEFLIIVIITWNIALLPLINKMRFGSSLPVSPFSFKSNKEFCNMSRNKSGFRESPWGVLRPVDGQLGSSLTLHVGFTLSSPDLPAWPWILALWAYYGKYLALKSNCLFAGIQYRFVCWIFEIHKEKGSFSGLWFFIQGPSQAWGVTSILRTAS